MYQKTPGEILESPKVPANWVVKEPTLVLEIKTVDSLSAGSNQVQFVPNIHPNNEANSYTTKELHLTPYFHLASMPSNAQLKKKL